MSWARCRPRRSQLGTDARVLLPGFPAVLAGLTDLEPVADLGRRVRRAATSRLERGMLQPNGVVVYVVRGRSFYDRPGNPYLNDAHRPYGDNDRRFALLGWAAARVATAPIPTGRRRSSTRTTGTRGSRRRICARSSASGTAARRAS